MKEKQKAKKSPSLFATLNAPCIELSGNRELLLEGSKGILRYSPECVRVNTGGMLVTVTGRELNLRCISESALMIDGFIADLRFEVS